MSNILLTGSSGFIGTYFKQHYDNKFHITTFSFLRDNFDKLNMNEIDTVVHLSALVHQINGASKQAYEDVNVRQTLELAMKAKEQGVIHFIFMSTIKVYGEESSKVYTEKSSCHPQDAYGKSKLKAENELLKLQADTFKISIIRTPVVYGVGVKANIANLVKVIQKVPILPFANIKNRRSIVYIGNLSAIIDKIITFKKSGIFLAADDYPVSTTELIKIIAKTMNKRLFLFSIPFLPSLIRVFNPLVYQRIYGNLEIDNQQTKKNLDFKNMYTTKEGIHLMLGGERQYAGK